jgi:anhydro-N-acetylmuramic acid kinase
MVYRAIGLMSGSSLDGLDICFVEFDEAGGRWGYEIKAAECIRYTAQWQADLANAIHLNAFDYLKLHTAYGHFTGEQVNAFIEKYNLHHQIALVASHGHTTFHSPENKTTAQLGDGAAIAATTGLNVVSDLRSIDVALGGQGAPIVPIGEKLLFGNYELLLNLGGIANISLSASSTNESAIAFDVCPANAVLNSIVAQLNLPYDNGGAIAATGEVNQDLLAQLNALEYYQQSFPKSLANGFGLDTVVPILQQSGMAQKDLLRTYVAHICEQVKAAIIHLNGLSNPLSERKMLVTGGGAFNTFLVEQLKEILQPLHVEIVVPDDEVVQYKEALIMALIGVLRWREEENVFASVTGASRNSVGGALWLGNI